MGAMDRLRRGKHSTADLALVAAAIEEARFLLQRIAVWERDGITDDNASEWGGHVAPPLARLGAFLERL